MHKQSKRSDVRRHLLHPFATLALAGIVGCDWAPDALTSPSPLPGLQAAAAAAPDTLHRLVQQPVGPRGRPPLSASARLAEVDSKFGGAFVDAATRTLHVYLTDMANAATTRAVLEAEVHRRGRPELTVTVRPGQFAYAQLEAWRDTLRFGRATGVVLQEVDERRNRLRIGVLDEVTRSRVAGMIERTNVPRAAVLVEIVPEPVPLATLRDRYRPLRGGLQIFTAWDQNGFYGFYGRQTATCTYGINVTYGGAAHMITNSHCTQHGRIGGLINAAGAQAGDTDWDRYGTEIQDPALQSGLYGCPAGEECRYSDAALFRIDNDPITGSLTWNDLGGIMRTTQRGTLPTIYASLTVSGSPRIPLSGILQDVYVGDVIEKVGRTTGWSAGEVTSTSSTLSLADGTRLDNVTVRAASGGGDSGSPVFFQASTGGYFLAGILWGGLKNYDGVSGDTFIYSKWRNVDYELGEPLVNDLYPIPSGGGGGGGGGEPCVPEPGGPPCPV